MKNLVTDSNPTDLENQQLSASKRTLLKTGWVAPVIVALDLPRSGYAANMSGTTKNDKSHEGDKGKHRGKD